MTLFSKLAMLDHEVLDLQPHPRPDKPDPSNPALGREERARRERLALKLAERGNLKTQLCLPQLAVLDLMRAQAQHANLDRDENDSTLGDLRDRFDSNVEKPAPFALNAQLGEALRLEARDVFLSSPGGAPDFHLNIGRSIACFTRALKDLSSLVAGAALPRQLEFGKPSEYKAWILAHRGAALTAKIWILLVGGKTVDPLFMQAEGDLRAALDNHPTYAWARRFLAVLLTLKAGPEDLARATRLLETTDSIDPNQESSLHQSLALLSYMAATEAGSTERPRRRAAAMRAIEEAVLATNIDPDKCMAPYFAAASLVWLLDDDRKNGAGESDEERTLVTEENSSAAIDSAVVHAQNALSQATACLIGALKLRQRLAKNSDQGTTDAAAEDARIKALAAVFKSSYMDLETAAIILRDPNLADLGQPIANDGAQSPLRSFTDPYCSSDAYLDLKIDFQRFG
jgi:hypothetical protein